MPDTGAVRTVDLNADLGEADSVLPSDLAILSRVSSANIACGFHAGSREVMRALCETAVGRGVAVGAHVSYRDREGFGRRPVDVPPRELARHIAEQCRVLAEEAAPAGATVSYLKPHGALYHRMAVDARVAGAVLEGMALGGIGVVLAPPRSVVARLAGDGGPRVVVEGFADRVYRADGTLAPRGEPGAVVDDPEEAARRAVSLAVEGGITADDGTWVELRCRSLCVHGDTPGAVETATAVRAALASAGVSIDPFAGP
jgi:UPF0271 protein